MIKERILRTGDDSGLSGQALNLITSPYKRESEHFWNTADERGNVKEATGTGAIGQRAK